VGFNFFQTIVSATENETSFSHSKKLRFIFLEGFFYGLLKHENETEKTLKPKKVLGGEIIHIGRRKKKNPL